MPNREDTTKQVIPGMDGIDYATTGPLWDQPCRVGLFRGSEARISGFYIKTLVSGIKKFVLAWVMTRTLKQILDHLEGPGFYAELNPAAGIKTARAVCESDPDWQTLVRILQLHEIAGGDALDIVSARFWSWATMEVPPPMRAYGHPKDVACFAVIYAVSKAAPGRVDRMLQDVKFGPEWFWLAMITDVVLCSRETERTPGSTAPRSACSG